MAENFYYVYALKDPALQPAKPFYVGKGTGSRVDDHLVTPDRTRKCARSKRIIEAGAQPLVDVLVNDLTETQALRLESFASWPGNHTSSVGSPQAGSNPERRVCLRPRRAKRISFITVDLMGGREPTEDPMLDLVLYHTPNFYGWMVR